MAVHALAERIPERSEFRTMAESAFSAVDHFRKTISGIKSDRRLSAEGHLEKIRDAAKSGPLAYFAGLREQIASERKSLEKRRAHFRLPPPDKDNLFAEMRAQETRALLRTMPVADKLRLALENPEIAKAVVGAPAALSGFNDELHGRVVAAELERQFGEELATLRAEAEIVDTVGIAIDVAEKQLLNEYEPQPAKAA